MSKVTLSRILSGFSSASKTNANLQLIEDALDNTLSRNGLSPNEMNSNLDMNGFKVLNVQDASSDSEPVTLRQLNEATSGDLSVTISALPLQSIDGFVRDNLLPNLTNSEVTRALGRFRAVRAGSVTGIIITTTETQVAGSATVEVFINNGLAGATGTGTGLKTVLDTVHNTRNVTTQGVGVSNFLAGDEIYVVVTTTSAWLPATADIRCSVEIRGV